VPKKRPGSKSAAAVGAAKKRLARNLRSWRAKRGLTQEEVAARAGMLWQNYQELESAKRNLTLETLVRVAAALEVDVAELLR